MSDVRTEYGSATTIICTCSGLADNGMRESTVVLNSVNRFTDAFVQATALANSVATLTTTPMIYLYSYGGVVSTSYSGGASGADAAFTTSEPQSINGCTMLGTFPIITMGAALVTIYKSDIFSVAAGFGGVLPINWGVIVDNQTGQSVVSVKLQYQGLYSTIT